MTTQALVRRGKFLTTTFLLEVGATPWLISISEGKIVSVTKGPFVMPSSAFALRAAEEEWQKFWSRRPPPGSNDLLAMVQPARAEDRGQSADLHGEPALLQGSAGQTARGSFGMSAKFEPIVGRYMHLELFGRPHRIYVEEAGEGTPLLCLHTAGTDGRQYRGLMNDTRVTSRHRVIAFDMPWHGKSSPPAGWHDEEYQLTSAHYTTMVLEIMAALEAGKTDPDRLLDRRAHLRCIWRSSIPNAFAPSSACRPARMSIPITT